ncbi:hypothetical protein ONZ43_g5058 [Nemania bipapillata]|uniref:Uncharacterized protein n=1 Tax=Nemania bipapillata TaxID=110536 RepID=A0ACC2IF99_9PEZI|nr:hypothetical protein ONZ43_g5058 [Nemania bipapillata]
MSKLDIPKSRNPLRSLITQLTPLEYPSSDFTGKTILVTGATSGLGLEAARHFVRLNAERVVLGCRNVEQGRLVKEEIESSQHRIDVCEVWPVDLGSFDSVKSFCRRAEQLDHLDIVVENAGVSSKHYEVLEGYERQITVNVISTYLMAFLLLPKLQQNASQTNAPHLVIVASNAHRYTSIRESDFPSIFESFRGPSNMNFRYPISKLLVVLVARELSRLITSSFAPGQHVIINSLDTGLCKTNLFREEVWPISWVLNAAMILVGRTAEMGCRVLLWAASAGPETHGRYIEDCKVSHESPFVRSDVGEVAQKKVFDELVEILEGIDPGVTSFLRITQS